MLKKCDTINTILKSKINGRKKGLSRLVLIDGNSILNRAFYGIMGNKMLITKDGTYTNAVYGFLAVFFKIIEDLNPEYIAVAFDLSAPTARHKMYEGYKATRKGMPNELASQMPILKEILKAMHITIIEKEGYEADDILGTLAKRAEKKGLEVTILSGDRDTFQLASNHITIRIPRTKVGKTEIEDFDSNKVEEIYGVKPKQLIDVKGLMGDNSDNIPGVPGIGEKTALMLIQEYGNMNAIYRAIERGTFTLKGKAKQNIIAYKDLAYLSRTLGTINTKVPIKERITDLKVVPWDEEKVLSIFKELNFNRFIERFHLISQTEQEKKVTDLFSYQELEGTSEIMQLQQKIIQEKRIFYYFHTKEDKNPSNIIAKKIVGISVYLAKENTVYTMLETEKWMPHFTTIFEDKEIQKLGYKQTTDYILLKQLGIQPTGFAYDAEIAAYDINPTNIPYHLEELSDMYLGFETKEYLLSNKEKTVEEEKDSNQINLFDALSSSTAPKEQETAEEKNKYALYVYCIAKLYDVTMLKLETIQGLELFQNIEMPMVEILSEMQYSGIYVDKKELMKFGKSLQKKIDKITEEIYEMCGETFNLNSTKQLGEVLFEKLKLPVYKKTKKGYSTDVDVLEKLKKEHPVIDKILEYRQLAKLNSTYVEGLIPYINETTHKIHSYFHQTVAATGRITSTEPNLQNIPTRIDFGKKLKKAFKAEPGKVFIDADYSQIELRVLAHISKDERMLEAFKNDEDIHKQVASQVFNVPLEKVTKSQRGAAKAVNFGIVYGISDFGLSEQIGVPKKKAREYIDQYLEKYKGIEQFMKDIVTVAKNEGYVETMFHRRRYIPEINSNNFIVRQFGARAAMNTPIQGTAADIMKIAMLKVYRRLKEEHLSANIILQIHDELLIEAKEEEKEQVKKVLKECMENAVQLDIPLKVETSEATNWYDVK